MSVVITICTINSAIKACTSAFKTPHSTLLATYICALYTMNLFAPLSLLALTLLCTQLESCERHEIKEQVNTKVQRAVAGLKKRLSLMIDSTDGNIRTTNNAALENQETRKTNTIERLLQSMKQRPYYPPLGPQNSTAS